MLALILQTYLPGTVPLTYYALGVGAFCITTNVPPSQRALTLPFVFIAQYLAFTTADRWPGDLGSLWGLLICIWLAHATSILWFEDPAIWHETSYLVRHSRLAYYVPDKWYRPLRLWNNPRLLGTSRQVPGVRGSTDSPALGKFTIVRVGKLLAYWTTYTTVNSHVFPGLFIPIHLDEFSPPQEAFFRRLLLPPAASPVTLREILLRAACVLWWGFSTVATLDGVHSALSLLAVSVLGFDAPTEWPPIFGSLSDAWTIRRFWAKFWHQVVVRPYKNYGQYFSRNILRLKPDSAPDKILVIFFVFFLSGVSHAAVSRQLGDRCGWLRDVWWFCMNFVAGGLETMVVQLTRAAAGKLGQKPILDRLARSEWCRAFGFTWVFLFLFWSIPKWQYPKLYCHLQDALAQLESSRL